jgi:hypothetical protein
LNIKPVTTEGSTPGWFLLRGFSFGSSTSDMLLLVIKRYVQQSDDEPNEEILEAAKPILEYLHDNVAEDVRAEAWGEEEAAPTQEESAEEPNDEGINEQAAVNDNGDIIAALIDHDINSIEYVKLKVKHLLSMPIDAVEVDLMVEHIGMAEEIPDEVRICIVIHNLFLYCMILTKHASVLFISVQTLKLYVEEMGGKSVKSRAKNEERAVQWVNSNPLERPLVFKTLTQLRKQCSDHFNRPTKEFADIKDRSTLVDMILGRADVMPATMSNAGLSLDLQLLKEVLKSTFMGKLTGKRKEYAKGKNFFYSNHTCLTIVLAHSLFYFFVCLATKTFSFV